VITIATAITITTIIIVFPLDDVATEEESLLLAEEDLGGLYVLIHVNVFVSRKYILSLSPACG